MPEVTTPYEPGTPCWIDLVAPDQQAAIDFYSALFGWTGEIGPPEMGGYSICRLKGQPVAGIMSAQAMGDQPAPPTVWTTYFASSDVGETEAAVKRNGGSLVVPPMTVVDQGRMMVATDPAGAVFGLWEPLDFFGARIANESGALIWSELNTSDRAGARQFYPAVLGMGTEAMEGAEDYFALTVNGRAVGGLQALPEAAPPDAPSHWLVYFAVDDTDDTTARLAAAGGSVIQPPFDMVAGRMALVTDPQGAPFAVITPKM